MANWSRFARCPGRRLSPSPLPGGCLFRWSRPFARRQSRFKGFLYGGRDHSIRSRITTIRLQLSGSNAECVGKSPRRCLAVFVSFLRCASLRSTFTGLLSNGILHSVCNKSLPITISRVLAASLAAIYAWLGMDDTTYVISLPLRRFCRSDARSDFLYPSRDLLRHMDFIANEPPVFGRLINVVRANKISDSSSNTVLIFNLEAVAFCLGIFIRRFGPDGIVSGDCRKGRSRSLLAQHVRNDEADSAQRCGSQDPLWNVSSRYAELARPDIRS